MSYKQHPSVAFFLLLVNLLAFAVHGFQTSTSVVHSQPTKSNWNHCNTAVAESLMDTSLDEPASFEKGSLSSLCVVTKRACDLMVPMIVAMYESINENVDDKANENDSNMKKLKDDKSVFSIADGMVQHLLTQHLFGRALFKDIVGEEECEVDLQEKGPFQVDGLTVPEQFRGAIESAIKDIKDMSEPFFDEKSGGDSSYYKDLTIFIDPIDGTREFTSNKGEQCSICIGFADSSGVPVAGVVYRPLTNPPTWAAGAKSEKYTASHLKESGGVNVHEQNQERRGLLTSNGSISPFIEALMAQLDFERIPSGGAGNKMLMLLEGQGSAYIQDRGVSRWDTCAAQAVIEAHGGILCKMTSFLDGRVSDESASYTYLKSDKNLDFLPGTATLSRHNCSPKSKSEDIGSLAQNVLDVKPYSNLCGLVVLSATQNTQEATSIIVAGTKKAAEISSPAYN